MAMHFAISLSSSTCCPSSQCGAGPPPPRWTALLSTVSTPDLVSISSSCRESKRWRKSSAELHGSLRWKNNGIAPHCVQCSRDFAFLGTAVLSTSAWSGSLSRREDRRHSRDELTLSLGSSRSSCFASNCFTGLRCRDHILAVSSCIAQGNLISNEKSWSQCLAMADPSANPAGGGPPAQEITIANKSGLKLKGILVESASGSSKEVCILCHGFRSSKLSSTLSSLSNALVEAGVSTFRFDFSGNGESEGQFAYGNYWQEVEDLRAVVEYWTSRGSRVVCVAGHSKGGNCVVLYASKYHDVPCVINISGRFALEKGVLDRLGGEEGLRKLEEEGVLDIKDATGEVQYQVTKADLRDRLTTYMHAACVAIPEPTRVLTIHGTKDEVVPADDAYQFAQRIQNHKLLLLKDADHGYRSHQRDLAKHVLEFLQDSSQS